MVPKIGNPLRWPASEIKVELVGVHNQLWTDSQSVTSRQKKG